VSIATIATTVRFIATPATTADLRDGNNRRVSDSDRLAEDAVRRHGALRAGEHLLDILDRLLSFEVHWHARERCRVRFVGRRRSC